MKGPTLAVSVVLAALGTACAPQGQAGGAIGSSSNARGAATGSAPSGDGGASTNGTAPSPVPRDFRTSMARVSAGRFLSKGHAGGRWDAEVYADDAGAALIGKGRAELPVGARFVEEHFERSDGGAGPIMMMEKEAAGFDPAGGNWRYVAVGARGDVVKDGIVEGCAGCHGEAPADHVFRVGSQP